MNTYDPVLFDLDGTLVDSGADIASAVNRTLRTLGMDELAPSEIIGYVGDGVRKLMQRTLAEQGQDKIDQAIASFKNDYFSRCLEATTPYDGIVQILERIKDKRMAVVTNKPVAYARQILQGLDLLGYFDAVVGGDEAELKPNPAPIVLALHRMDCDSSGGIMVGDHSNDILAGKAAGLATCGVTWGLDHGQSIKDAKSDHICTTPEQLAKVLGI